jgi:hypothetical protein
VTALEQADRLVREVLRASGLNALGIKSTGRALQHDPDVEEGNAFIVVTCRFAPSSLPRPGCTIGISWEEINCSTPAQLNALVTTRVAEAKKAIISQLRAALAKLEALP